jgi:acetylornithine/N-succinyldiaminopimelate aminotransferase
MVSERQLFLSHLAQTSDIPLMLEVEHAEGIYLFDRKGKKYIDFISGIAVSSLGHNNPCIIDAIKKQLDKHLHLMVYGEYIQSVQVQLAEKTASLLPGPLNAAYFVNSGTEANEGAVKLAKRYTARHKIISFKNAYHGSTQGSLSLMGNETFKNAFRPLLPGIQICEMNNQQTIDAIDNQIAAVIMEPIQAESGIMIPEIGFLKKVRDKCTQTGTLLIFDEAQTGFGRTGTMFGFEHSSVVPDIITFAKAFGGGMPLGAFVSSQQVMQSLMNNPVLGHITTFGGHPVSCAASLAAIQYIEDHNLHEAAKEKEKTIRDNLAHPKIQELRGCGLFIAMQLQSFDAVRKVILHAMEHGLITDWFLFCDSAIRIAPPLTITHEEIIMACGILKRALDTL